MFAIFKRKLQSTYILDQYQILNRFSYVCSSARPICVMTQSTSSLQKYWKHLHPVWYWKWTDYSENTHTRTKKKKKNGEHLGFLAFFAHCAYNYNKYNKKNCNLYSTGENVAPAQKWIKSTASIQRCEVPAMFWSFFLRYN